MGEVAFFACGDEILRQITNVFDILYLTRDFKIHCCFLKYLVEPFFFPNRAVTKLMPVKSGLKIRLTRKQPFWRTATSRDACSMI